MDACGAGGGASRFPFSCDAPRDELLRNVCLPGRIAAPLRFFAARPAARSARCPLRSSGREHSVYETAAQPQRNFQPSITGDTPLTARRRRHRPKNKTPQEGPPARGEAPVKHIGQRSGHEKQGAQPPGKNTSRFSTTHDTDDELGTARRRRHQRWTKNQR